MMTNDQIEAEMLKIAEAVVKKSDDPAVLAQILESSFRLGTNALQNLNSIAQSLEAIAMNVEQMNGDGAA